MFKKLETTFDLRGRSIYTQAEMTSRIKDLMKRHYGIAPNIGGNNWSNYYRPDGAKVTKTLTSILRKGDLTKAEVDEQFPKFAKDIAELYHPTKRITAYFGDKSELGEGIYEGGGPTCIADGHQNQASKKFVQVYKRTQMLCLEHPKDPNSDRPLCARCIAYFPGGRNIFLTNFYYNGMQNNRLIFVEAVRRMFNWDKVIWKSNEIFFLPIFRNGGCLHVHPERFRDYHGLRRLLPCPECRKLIHENDYYYEERSHGRYMGCTKKCADKVSGMVVECGHCGVMHGRETGIRFRDQSWCRDCYMSETAGCASCGRRFLIVEIAHTADGVGKCEDCMARSFKCFVCDRRFHHRIHRVKDNPAKKICTRCAKDGNHSCHSCGYIYEHKVNKTHRGRPICDYCYKNANPEPAKPEREAKPEPAKPKPTRRTEEDDFYEEEIGGSDDNYASDGFTFGSLRTTTSAFTFDARILNVSDITRTGGDGETGGGTSG